MVNVLPLRMGNFRTISTKIITIAVTLLGLLTLTFLIGRVMPVDPVLSIVGPDADNETYQQVYRQLGLDLPLYQQYLIYINDLLHGDLGNTAMTGQPVLEEIIRVIPATIELGTLAIIIGVALGIPLGVYAASQKGRVGDYIVRVMSLTGYSIPVFWFGMMGLLIFYAWLNWVGGAGRVDLYFDGVVENKTGFLLIDSAISREWDVFRSAFSHLILPASILGLHSMAYISRMTRSFMLTQLSQEYIITARVKGLSPKAVLWSHAFKNIRVQLLTIIALTYGTMLEGAVLIETVFSWPGFGQYLTHSLLHGDMNSVMGCVLIIGIIFITLNLISDALYKVFDPRTN